MVSGVELAIDPVFQPIVEEVDLAQRLAPAVEPVVNPVPGRAFRGVSARDDRPYGWTNPSIREM